MKKIMVIYPPGRCFQRGEERCQSNVKQSTSTFMRACNDLGYIAAIARTMGWSVFLRDYQTENAQGAALEQDFQSFSPDFLFISTTNATLPEDLAFAQKLKSQKRQLQVMLKGAIFFAPPDSLLNDRTLLSTADYLIAENAELVIQDILTTDFPREKICGLYYKKNGFFEFSNAAEYSRTYDELPFPARDLMKNDLYQRPDTGMAMATITTSRGCPSGCIFCLTPFMSGRKVFFRKPENIVREIAECVEKYEIREFFFRADTFTIQKSWTMELCRRIIDAGLAKKIKWVANTRVKPLDEELLLTMKAAGCRLVAVGFESGSNETLSKAGKGTTVEDNRKAAVMIHKAGLGLYGFYLVGFPWEGKEHLDATRRLIFETAPDFLELHIAVPFYGTKLYEMAKEMNLISQDIISCDCFAKSPFGTKYLSEQELQKFRNRTIASYLLSIPYLCARFREALLSPVIFRNYAKHGLHLLFQLFQFR